MKPNIIKFLLASSLKELSTEYLLSIKDFFYPDQSSYKKINKELKKRATPLWTTLNIKEK